MCVGFLTIMCVCVCVCVFFLCMHALVDGCMHAFMSLEVECVNMSLMLVCIHSHMALRFYVAYMCAISCLHVDACTHACLICMNIYKYIHARVCTLSTLLLIVRFEVCRCVSVRACVKAMFKTVLCWFVFN